MNEKDRSNVNIMQFKEANCRNCYKCMRSCPVKAVSILSDQAKIEDKRCVYCGKCYIVCLQNARDDSKGDLERVKMMVRSGDKVYVSISSSFTMYFSASNLRRIAAALKKLGIKHVEETSIGTKRILEEYMKHINSGRKRNIISSHCPSANYMVQKYYPRLIKWLLPVVTPLEAHAMMMKKAYGDDIKVVGVGPCIAYQKLALEAEDGLLIDGYINYEDLEKWMKSEGVEVTAEEDSYTYAVSRFNTRYTDESNGLFRSLDQNVKKKYTLWTADGITRADKILRDFHEGISGHFVELLSCNDSCLGGPIVRLAHKDTFERKTQWIDSIRENPKYADEINPSEYAEVDVFKEYKRMDNKEPMPTEEQIADILRLVGKKTQEDLIDCGGCGYTTCREKAIAVFQGLADPYMCIPYSRESAELQSNLLFDNSPSGVLVLDSEMNIIQANEVAATILGSSAEELNGHAVTKYFPKNFIDKSRMMEKPNRDTELYCDDISKVLSTTFFKISKRSIYMLIFDDITERSQMIEKEKAVRRETIQITKDVVEKQMRIAQEIASLLGDTTAETKLAFNKLRNSLEKSEKGWKS